MSTCRITSLGMLDTFLKPMEYQAVSSLASDGRVLKTNKSHEIRDQQAYKKYIENKNYFFK